MAMWEKINRLKDRQASLIIVLVGFCTYFVGLFNGFLGDDQSQIVQNPIVHSISHIAKFFQGGTFYEGAGTTKLGGAYFRPLTTTTFSFIYSIFGAHPFWFHLVQLIIFIGSAVLVYLFFRFSFKPALALFLALVLLVHPVDSMVAYAIPNTQDALFFFFGMLAIYLLIKYQSIRSLVAVAICLLLSLFSKETGVLFVAVALLYMFWFNRQRLYSFIGIMVLPVALYIVLRVNAIGWFGNPNNAPITKLDLAQRLLTAPSVIWFYIPKFLFPYKLASAYYWVYPHFSFKYFVIPLLLDLIVIAIVVYAALFIRRKATKATFYSFLFFAIWSAIGLLLVSQILPLDMTATEAWFYFPMVGVLGMMGILIDTLKPAKYVDKRLLIAVAAIIVVVLGLRTALRGPDFKSQVKLASVDITVSKQDYAAYYVLSFYDLNHHKYEQSKEYGMDSVAIFQDSTNELTLGAALAYLGDNKEAWTDITDSLHYNRYKQTYDYLSVIALSYGSPQVDRTVLAKGLKYYPHDYNIWQGVVILDELAKNSTQAKEDITEAAENTQVSQVLYYDVMKSIPFAIHLDSTSYLHVP
jgi:hypothetical protein